MNGVLHTVNITPIISETDEPLQQQETKIMEKWCMFAFFLCLSMEWSSVCGVTSKETPISPSNIVEKNINENGFHGDKQTKSSRSSRFFPFNTQGLFSSSGSQQSFLNQIKNLYSAQPSTDDLAGRFFKIMSTPNMGMDPSQALVATLNANIPRIADAYASIADSLETISSEWEIQLSEMVLMQIIAALEEIATNSGMTMTTDPNAGTGPRRRG
ncbi:UNVERIFIED_CONTAM: hypothetical protein RMT77_017440 [Armadillidium vulgare]